MYKIRVAQVTWSRNVNTENAIVCAQALKYSLSCVKIFLHIVFNVIARPYGLAKLWGPQSSAHWVLVASQIISDTFFALLSLPPYPPPYAILVFNI